MRGEIATDATDQTPRHRCQDTSDPGHLGPETFRHHQTGAELSAAPVHMSFRLVLNSVILNDLERRNSQSCHQGLSLRGQGQGQDFFLKAKDIKIFRGQHQGQLRQLPLRAKICIYL